MEEKKGKEEEEEEKQRSQREGWMEVIVGDDEEWGIEVEEGKMEGKKEVKEREGEWCHLSHRLDGAASRLQRCCSVLVEGELYPHRAEMM